MNSIIYDEDKNEIFLHKTQTKILLFIFCREKAVLAVTLCNDKEEILGHAAFFDYPNIDDVDSATWEDWFHKHYDDPKITALNSLYMHYFVAKSEYSSGCAKEIIRTAFNAVPDLHYLFLNVPMGTYPGKYPQIIVKENSCFVFCFFCIVFFVYFCFIFECVYFLLK